ncbi:rRNA maturation RNase YbeY [bacterium]|nr:rRNA maturation RNase YbeY [bacterium]
MKANFTLSKIDDINLKKYNIVLKSCKMQIKKILDILLNLTEIKKSSVFSPDISKIRFDVSFCNNNTIHQINREYRNKDSVTDVITFSLFCDDKNALIYRKTADLGQIVISLERCDEQKSKSFEYELLTLITHGILHLLGFDHLNKKDYDFVVGIQNTVLKELGL